MKNKQLNMNEVEKAIDFMEELAWLLESKKSIKLKTVTEELRNLLQHSNENFLPFINSKNDLFNNKRFLIGIFPTLFQDGTLFPTVNSIIEFANEVLHLNISEAKKRSRNEIIGQIVCQTNVLNDYQLERVVRALSQLFEDETKLEEVKRQKTLGNFSWNATIQKLTEFNYNE